jgi:hypothetical protein
VIPNQTVVRSAKGAWLRAPLAIAVIAGRACRSHRVPCTCAIWIIGVPFERRHATAMCGADFFDLMLVGFLIGDFAYGVWLVWFARGLRWRMLIIAGFQFVCCCVVVYGDLLWSAGAP